MAIRPDFIEFDVSDGRLGALRWPGIDGAPTVLALHGITSNAWYFDPLAHRFAGAANIVALDLRGRGRSFGHTGPFGIRQHADDVARVVQDLGGRAFVLGHSMGAFVALMAAARHPSLVSGLVLVDGGPALPGLGDDTTVEDALDRTLGPGLQRVRTVWPDRVSYNTMWSQHPAFSNGLTIDLERNLLADLIDVPGGFRTAVNEAAVMIDGRDLLVDDEVRSLLADRMQPTTILRAPAGLDGAPPPFISDASVEALPRHRWVTVPGTNHYTILLSPTGADAVATELRRELQAG